ncbi:hypothetical protein B0A55_03309 [Friedmanniomyces simplex]|uniref:Uncharacterized protein n=1 Tax=Friedmanniomyces simplex TaxID=329884 RepID=A0A4U0XT96_9PEZI|nr:hypothetical protein B0A55_03309 [Friedmanniomyces simplex]
MCYIPLDTIPGPLELPCDIYIMPVYTVSVSAKVTRNISTSSVAKRKASATLEPERSKRPRASSEANEAMDGSDGSEDEQSGLPEVEETSERMSAQTAKLRGSKMVVSDARKLRGRVAELQRNVIKASPKSRTSSGAVNHAVEESIKQGYKVKLQTAKDQYETRLESIKGKSKAKLDLKHAVYQQKVDKLKSTQVEALRAKDESVKRRIEENCVKCIGFVKAAREKEQEAKSELAKAQKEFTELGKNLKTEQQAEISKWKPEISPVLKDRDKTIKELQVTLAKTQAEVKICEQEIDRLLTNGETLEQIIEKYKVGEGSLSAEVREKEKEITSLKRKHAEKSESALKRHTTERTELTERLKLEGNRWQNQYDIADSLKYTLVEQQRANFELRGMTVSRDRRIRLLNMRIGELEAMTAEQGKRIAALDSGIGELESETTTPGAHFGTLEVTNGKSRKDLERAKSVDDSVKNSATVSQKATMMADEAGGDGAGNYAGYEAAQIGPMMSSEVVRPEPEAFETVEEINVAEMLAQQLREDRMT